MKISFLHSYKKYTKYCLQALQLACFSLPLLACATQAPSSGYYSTLQDSKNNSAYNSSSSNQAYYNNPNKAQKIPQTSTGKPKRLPGHYKPYVVFGKSYYPLFDAEGFTETGLASWYGPPFHGRKTSNGETYNMHAETAAHKTLPMGTIVRVTNLDNNRVAVLRINDRGPFVGDRIIDLSKTAAQRLDIIRNGTGRVKVEVVQAPPAIQAKHLKNYYVQVGAFSDEIKAKTITSEIKRMGMQTRLVKADKKSIWRVQVGPLKQMKDTTKAQAELALDFPESYVVIE